MKFKKHITCTCGYKLVCANDKFNKPFKNYVYNFINSMIEESKYCSELKKKQFKKEYLMAKKDNEDFKNSTKCWICDDDYIDDNVKVRDHCYITGKYSNFAHRCCNINLKGTLIRLGSLRVVISGVRGEGAQFYSFIFKKS